MDLKDFFMTGTAKFFTHHASLLVRLRFRKVFRNVLLCLLNKQLVTSSVCPNDFWKVVVGSGMGLRCSSELADAALSYAASHFCQTLQEKNTVSSRTQGTEITCCLFVVPNGAALVL